MPVLVEVFTREGVRADHLLPLAIGTSAATIVFTAFASARAHHKRGAVAWPIVMAMAPGLVIGVQRLFLPVERRASLLDGLRRGLVPGVQRGDLGFQIGDFL